jgi:hypothetical protein
MFSLENLKGGDHVEDLGVDGKILRMVRVKVTFL